MKQIVYLLAKGLFFQVFRWQEKAIWQRGRNKLVKLRNAFCSNPENLNSFFQQIHYLSKFFVDTEKAVLTILLKRFREILICLFGSKWEIDQIAIYFFSRRTVFRQKILMETENAILTLQPINFLLQSKLFSFESPRRWTKFYTSEQNDFFLKCLLDTKKAVLFNFAEIFAKFIFFCS